MTISNGKNPKKSSYSVYNKYLVELREAFLLKAKPKPSEIIALTTTTVYDKCYQT